MEDSRETSYKNTTNLCNKYMLCCRIHFRFPFCRITLVMFTRLQVLVEWFSWNSRILQLVRVVTSTSTSTPRSCSESKCILIPNSENDTRPRYYAKRFIEFFLGTKIRSLDSKSSVNFMQRFYWRSSAVILVLD